MAGGAWRSGAVCGEKKGSAEGVWPLEKKEDSGFGLELWGAVLDCFMRYSYRKGNIKSRREKWKGGWINLQERSNHNEHEEGAKDTKQKFEEYTYALYKYHEALTLMPGDAGILEKIKRCEEIGQ